MDFLNVFEVIVLSSLVGNLLILETPEDKGAILGANAL